MPVAVSVAVVDSKVQVNGTIVAKGSVTLAANSDITVTTLSTTGKLPLAIAVSVVVNDVSSEVTGSVQAGGTIDVTANGSSVVTTNAKKSGASGSNLGGFFAIGVVIQNTDAAVKGDGVLDAVGNINVKSTSNENAATNATSATPEAASGEKAASSGSVSSLKDSVVNILTKTVGALGTKYGSQFVSKIGTSLGFIKGTDGYTIT